MTIPPLEKPSLRRWDSAADALALTLAVIAGLYMLGLVMVRLDRGFDFTDEGYYLNSIATPGLYANNVTQFGWVYHPLYWLLGGDIALLRQANILVTVGLAWALSTMVLRDLRFSADGTISGRGRTILALGFICSTSALMVLRLWMPTPNYNSLTLQSLLLVAIGMLLAARDYSRRSLAGWGLIGAGGWLTFMAKPTSAAALAVVVLGYLAWSRKLRLHWLGVSLGTVTALAVTSAWLIDGSVIRFAWRIIYGAQDAGLQQGKHTVAEAFRFDQFATSRAENIVLALGTTAIFLFTFLAMGARQYRRLAGAGFVILCAAACLLTLGGSVLPEMTPAQVRFFGLQYLAAPFGATLAALAASFRKPPSALLIRERLALAAGLAVLPHVYAFGTDDNYWAAASWAAIFWILSGIALLGLDRSRPPLPRACLPLAAGAQVCTAVILFVYMERPYRLTQPLRGQTEDVEMAVTGAKLKVSRDYADYLARVRELAQKHGFQPGEPMLDLTGHYPGTLYAMGARAIGRPWMIGAYPGSDALAVAALDRIAVAELRRAWVLTEPTGPRKLSPQLLERYGLALERDYTEVGKLDSPTGTYPDNYQQRLLKPVDSGTQTHAR